MFKASSFCSYLKKIFRLRKYLDLMSTMNVVLFMTLWMLDLFDYWFMVVSENPKSQLKSCQSFNYYKIRT